MKIRTTDLWLFRFPDGWYAVPDWDVIRDADADSVDVGPFRTYAEAIAGTEAALSSAGYRWDGYLKTYEDVEGLGDIDDIGDIDGIWEEEA